MLQKLLLFKSKLSALLVGLTAMVTVPVIGAVILSFTILPDIGKFSRGETVLLWGYGLLCLFLIVYAHFAGLMLWYELCKKSSSPLKKWLQCVIPLTVVPVIGIFIILMLCYIVRGRLDSRKTKICSIGVLTCELIYVVFFVSNSLLQLSINSVLLVSLAFFVSNTILMIIILGELTQEKIVISAKITIAALLLCLFGAISALPVSTWLIDRKVDKAMADLAATYKKPLTPEALKETYYHGLKPNYDKFAKVMPLDRDGEDREKLKPEIPDDLLDLLGHSQSLPGLDRKLANWENENAVFFKDMDKVIGNEPYLKMPEKWRDYNNDIMRVSMPELRVMRHLTRVYSLRIQNALHKNDIRQALLLLGYMEKIHDYSLDGGVYLSFVVSLAIESARLLALEKIVSSGQLSNKDYLKLIENLKTASASWNKAWQQAKYGEAVTCIRVFNICMGEAYYEIVDAMGSGKGLFGTPGIDEILAMPCYWEIQNDKLYLLNGLMEREKSPYPGDNIKQLLKNMPENYHLSRLLLNDFSRVFDRLENICNQQQAAIVALQIQLYRDKYHHLPEKRSNLIPEFMDKMPIDSFSGKPFKYIHGKIDVIMYCPDEKTNDFEDKIVKTDGYCVYSVGSNKIDENGLFGYVNEKEYRDFGFTVLLKK